jgi:hypothetical protein
MVKSEVLWKLIPIQKPADTRVDNLVPAPINWSESSRGVTIDTRPVPFEYKITMVLKSGTVPVS